MVLDITDILEHCDVWGVLKGNVSTPSCDSVSVFPPDVSPIREECFESFEKPREEPKGQPRRAARRRGGRRRH
jgi:hypothetical protein